MATHQRKPYSGTERKLVIAFDVGTTFSGVSYALLDPGMVPQIKPVTQFFGQREPRGDSKVPSIVCYSQDGTVVAAGAETDPETNDALAEMDDVIRVEWFKLHLRPPHLAPSQEFEIQKLRSLPKNKTPVQVFGDFLRYLFQSTKKYILDSELWPWNSVEKNVYFVLSHPNGWEGKQQSQMRKAAITADLVDGSEASERISFVSEGEASLHFCLNKNPNLHNERDGILVVDCGGGTIDVSAYSQTIKGRFKEITQPESGLFDPAIQDIIQLIDDQRSRATVTIKTVLVVGGFARSNYLFSQLSAHFIRGVSIIRADTTYLNKAVADGAVSYFLDHYVITRVSKYSYGLKIDVIFDPTNPEHARRRNTKSMDKDGQYKIPGVFSTILKKDTEISEETGFRKSYNCLFTPEDPPEWIDLEPTSFHDVCVITADVTNVKKNMSSRYDRRTRKSYYQFEHDVELLTGLTELKVYITWEENGIEKRCVFSEIVGSVRSEDRSGVKQLSFMTTELYKLRNGVAHQTHP
ncbi:hypothetical protein JOM56_007871 [Amanita muscaria]